MIFAPRGGLSALLALGIVAVSNAKADDVGSANHLLPACRSVAAQQAGVNPFETGYCAGLIEGLRSTTMFLDPMCTDELSKLPGPTLGWRSCIPDGVTLSQTAAVIVHWLDQHPERCTRI
jgi:Rap1a immunity proteins